MAINPKKSACMRFGPKYRNVCANVVASRSVINWITSCRYLGVYLESSIKLSVPLVKTKPDFIRLLITSLGKSDAKHLKRFLINKIEVFASFVIRH